MHRVQATEYVCVLYVQSLEIELISFVAVDLIFVEMTCLAEVNHLMFNSKGLLFVLKRISNV